MVAMTSCSSFVELCMTPMILDSKKESFFFSFRFFCHFYENECENKAQPYVYIYMCSSAKQCISIDEIQLG